MRKRSKARYTPFSPLTVSVTVIRHIFRWDLDKTYLRAEFDSVRDLVRTARLSPEQRENIPGSAALLRAIRDTVQAGERHLIYFISGSPEQMRSTLGRKFALDGFSPDGFVLKPTVSNFLRGRFRAIRGQIAYKLGELVLGRSEAPVGTKETLFGDDAESDAFIYSLYSDLIAGDVQADELRRVLRKAGAYRDQIERILRALEAVVHERPVQRIIIHLDQRTPPAAFTHYFPRVVPIYNHIQTAIVLYLDGTLGPEAIQRVSYDLLSAYSFDVQRLSNLAEDILRRRRLRYPLEHFERLASDLRQLPAPVAVRGAPTDAALAERTQEVIEKIAERALYLKDRPLPPDPPPPQTKLDYYALLDAERERREETRRARKSSRASGIEPSESLATD